MMELHATQHRNVWNALPHSSTLSLHKSLCGKPKTRRIGGKIQVFTKSPTPNFQCHTNKPRGKRNNNRESSTTITSCVFKGLWLSSEGIILREIVGEGIRPVCTGQARRMRSSDSVGNQEFSINQLNNTLLSIQWVYYCQQKFSIDQPENRLLWIQWIVCCLGKEYDSWDLRPIIASLGMFLRTARGRVSPHRTVYIMLLTPLDSLDRFCSLNRCVNIAVTWKPLGWLHKGSKCNTMWNSEVFLSMGSFNNYYKNYRHLLIFNNCSDKIIHDYDKDKTFANTEQTRRKHLAHRSW